MYNIRYMPQYRVYVDYIDGNKIYRLFYIMY